MVALIITIFIIGYALIAFEHPLKINKSGTALLMGILIWTLYSIGRSGDEVSANLSHHLSGISEILFFLMGAMTIVEIIDAHDGFFIITNRINTTNKIRLLWIIAAITFLLSAALDNLTATIVMISLTRKLVKDSKQRLFYAGMIIVAANAGGAWSPIGDVTTTMLWIGGQVSTLGIMKALIVPSIFCLLVPLLYVTLFRKKELLGKLDKNAKQAVSRESKIIFFLGLGGFLFVPVFKQLFHLPPYLGVLLVLGVLWLTADIIHRKKETNEKKSLSASNAISRIDMPSILFFLGILLAVAGLESLDLLKNSAEWMDAKIGNKDVIIVGMGLLSAIVDNVPLVAATTGMYDLAVYPIDHKIWEFIAYCTGTGGSLLIIGSAAGVAAMGMEKIDFIWYLKKMSFITLLGYLSGAVVYLLQFQLLN